MSGFCMYSEDLATRNVTMRNVRLRPLLFSMLCNERLDITRKKEHHHHPGTTPAKVFVFSRNRDHPRPANKSSFRISAGGVAHIISVTRDPQVLIDASLDAVAAATKSDIDAAVHVTVGICAAVDFVRISKGCSELVELIDFIGKTHSHHRSRHKPPGLGTI
jgi:hypothetical protein